MDHDLERIRKNIQQATTEDLLDRATVYRAGMEEQPLVLVEWELEQRGIGFEALETHRKLREAVMVHSDGVAVICSFCHRPAIEQRWGWHRLRGKIPIFPRRFRYCEAHLPQKFIVRENEESL